MERVHEYRVEPVPRRLMADFVAAHHYAVRVPPHCLLPLGCFVDTDPSAGSGQALVGVASWGFGVRPRHTIQRLFPSLGTADYYELNRLCMLDSEPRNGESHFLRLCREYIRQREPGRVVLFSWADGMRGKPGFVYQADNWLYGGFIRTEFYVTAENEVVHPRQVITRCGHRDRAFTRSVGLRRVRGRQFRYCHFLCSHGLRKRLLRESPFRWGQEYPKREDCIWTFEGGVKTGAAEVSRGTREPPRFEGSGQFRDAAPLFAQAEGTPERVAPGRGQEEG
jgi:hypothetical protein